MDAQAEEVMSALTDAWNRADRDAFLALMHPDAETWLPRSALEGGAPYRGLEGMAQAWADSFDLWKRFEVVKRELRWVGDVLIDQLRVRCVPHREGPPVEYDGYYVTEFRDGKVAYWRPYLDRAEALDAAEARRTGWPSAEVVRRHVELIERARDAINRHDFDAVLPLISDDMELHPAVGGAFVGATTYRGKEGIRRYFDDVTEFIAGFRLDPLGYSAWRDYLVVPTSVSGRGRASGVDITADMTMIWRVRDGQVVWGGTFFSRAEGLEAIGATEAEIEPIDAPWAHDGA